MAAVILESFHNMLHDSNFRMTLLGRGHLAVLPNSGEGVVIAPRIKFDRPGQYIWFDYVRLCRSIPLIREFPASHGIHKRRIGIKHEPTTVGFHESLRDALPEADRISFEPGFRHWSFVRNHEPIIRSGRDRRDTAP